MYKAIIWSSTLALSVLAYHFEAIAGRWEFDRLCVDEGGSQFKAAYHPSDAHQAWEVASADPSTHRILLGLNNVGLVRFRDASGALMDARLQAAKKTFDLQPADVTKPVHLRLSVTQEPLAENSHLSRTRYLITHVAHGKVLAQHTALTYAWGAADRMLLSPPISASCYASPENLKAFLTTATSLKTHRGQPS
jgi:hypothetical protein